MNFSHLNTLFDAFLDPVLILGQNGDIIFGNTTAATWLESSQVRLSKNKPVEDFVSITGITFHNEEEYASYRNITYHTKKGATGKGQALVKPIQIEREGETLSCLLFILRDLTLEETLHHKYKKELESKEGLINELTRARSELEERVIERTKELNELNDFMSAMVNSLTQGLLVFNSEGIVMPSYTTVCHQHFDKEKISGTPFWDLLPSLPKYNQDTIKQFCTGIFKEMIPFAHYAKLGPQEFTKDDGTIIALHYHPLRNADKKIEAIVVLTSDVSSERMAKLEAQKEKKKAKMILNTLKAKEQLIDFFQVAGDMLKKMKIVGQIPQQHHSLYHYVHSLKGGASLFYLHDLESVCHHYESELSLREEERSQFSFQTMLEDLESAFKRAQNDIEHLFGPILQGVDGQNQSYSVDECFIQKMKHFLQTKNITDAQLLLTSLTDYFSPQDFFKGLTGQLQEMAEQSSKTIDSFAIDDQGLLILKSKFKDLFSTFIHAFKNSIAHGLQSHGDLFISFNLSFIKNTQWLFIELGDNGAGINRDKVRKIIALRRPEMTEEMIKNIDDHHVDQWILEDGISTATQITTLSGRGVGVGAIKESVEELSGKIEVYSEKDKGTKIVLMIPLAENDVIEGSIEGASVSPLKVAA
jgi:two-component system, chemotaxis family, sensor kinase CheA